MLRSDIVNPMVYSTNINFVKEAVEKRCPPLFTCIPQRKFFEVIGIGQIRWGQIMKKTGKPINIFELRQISNYFNITIEELTTKPTKGNH